MNLSLQLNCLRSLLSQESGAAFINYLMREAPNLVPERYSAIEPINKVFDPDKLDVVLDDWGDGFYWKRKQPKLLGGVGRVSSPGTRRPHHDRLSITISTNEALITALMHAVEGLSLLFRSDFSLLHPHPTRSEEVEFSIANETLQFGPRGWWGVLSQNLYEYVPDLYWATVFGPSYVQFFGMERLLTAPAPFVRALNNETVYIQLSERAEDLEDRYESIAATRSAIKRHLGMDAFFDLTKGKQSEYRVPEFLFDEDMRDPNRIWKTEPPSVMRYFRSRAIKKRNKARSRSRRAVSKPIPLVMTLPDGPQPGEEWHEFSSNFDTSTVRPFLERIQGHVESGFGPTEVDEIYTLVSQLQVDEERTLHFKIRHAGANSSLVVRVFMDDFDSPDILFLSTAALCQEIKSDFFRLTDEFGS